MQYYSTDLIAFPDVFPKAWPGYAFYVPLSFRSHFSQEAIVAPKSFDKSFMLLI
jgi:hypothetical protein